MSAPSPSLTGGCLCGATRYHLTTPPLQTTACHCADCRRASGAPFVVWTFFPTNTRRLPDYAPPPTPQYLVLRHVELSGTVKARHHPAHARSVNEVQSCLGNPDH